MLYMIRHFWRNSKMRPFVFYVLCFVLGVGFFHGAHALRRYKFELREVEYTRLCSTKKILTVNGHFPGQPIHVHKGETIIVDVYNGGTYNVTIHWHGVKMPRYPWTDGPEYITQCPIPPGGNFSQKVIFSDEEGTLWWHAHSNWTRNTVHGPIIIYPKKGSSYPYPKPAREIPIVLGEWWKQGIEDLYYHFLYTGNDPNVSDAFTINGQPGDLYNCSKEGTFKLSVRHGKSYLLRIINNALQVPLFFGVANHTLEVVGTDASYLKPFNTTYIGISPGQTIDAILHANQCPGRYYMAASVLERTPYVSYDNTTTTAIVEYVGAPASSTPSLPILPIFNDSRANENFTARFRSLATEKYPIDVPVNITKSMLFTFSVNAVPCTGSNDTCQGPNTTRLASSVNNAYYYKINGVYETNFPNFPPLFFNFTADTLPLDYEVPLMGTKVKVLDYNDNVEIVFQGTNVVDGADHPIHLHGHSFYVIGLGFGNWDKDKDPPNYNLVDPPYQNTITVPYLGWAVIRFKASNPGVWFMHCHVDRHMSWGMDMAFITLNGKTNDSKMLPPPPDMPHC
ncbi:Laccase-15-like protein [Drosera capensis]